MSAIQMAPNASGTGTLSIASPNTNSNRTLNLPDAAGTFVVGSSAASAVGQIPFSTDGSTYTPTAKIVSGTAVASTSGTSIDFTSIPSWVKRITVMFSGVSTNGTSTPLVQIGAGSVTTSGYLGVGNATVAGGATSGTNFTTGFGVQSALAANILHGHMVLTNVTSNTWVASHAMGTSNGTTTMVGSGTLALGGTLDRVRLTTVNGTDTFDAGSINLLWE